MASFLLLRSKSVTTHELLVPSFLRQHNPHLIHFHSSSQTLFFFVVSKLFPVPFICISVISPTTLPAVHYHAFFINKICFDICVIAYWTWYRYDSFFDVFTHLVRLHYSSPVTISLATRTPPFASYGALSC